MVVHIFVFPLWGGRNSAWHILVNELLDSLGKNRVVGESRRSNLRYLSWYEGSIREESCYGYLRCLYSHNESPFEADNNCLRRPVTVHQLFEGVVTVVCTGSKGEHSRRFSSS